MEVGPISPSPDGNGVERINEVKINLGRMHIGQLTVLETYCELRLEDAEHDLAVVRGYKERVMPGGAQEGRQHD